MPLNLPASALLGLAYALVGWASLQVSVPPDFVSVVFPAAGIALAAMMTWGVGVWPGVLAGSIAVNLLASPDLGTLGWASAIPPLVATLQARLGLWLCERLIGLPATLDTPRDILMFLGVVAPLSSLAGPLLSVPALVASGVIAVGEAPFNAFSWWLGDTLGVVLAAPLALAFIGQPSDAWRRRRLAISLPMLLMSLLTALVFNFIRDGEEQRIRDQFLREAEHLATQVDKRLATQIEILFATERFVALSLGFTREDFRNYATPFLQRYPGTQNFTWNPLVKRDERATFETVVRFADRLPNFGIVDRDESSPTRTRPADPADEYLPILFVEPIAGNEAVLGLNPLSIPNAAHAIAQSRETHHPIASEAFTLTQERAQQLGVVIYYAVRQLTGDEASGKARFVGLVTSAFRMDDVLAATLDEVSGQALLFCLLDRDAAPANRRLSGPQGCEHDDWLSVPLATSVPIAFTNRHWEIRVRAAPDYGARLRSAMGWLSIVVGLISSAILGAFLLVSTGHARRISALVAQRTAELATTTRDLVKQRSALDRAQDLARMGSWELDPVSGEFSCSEGLRALLGLAPEEYPTLAHLRAALHDDDQARLDELFAAASTRRTLSGQDMRTADTPPRILHVVMESEWSGDALERVLGTAQDVTATRRAESDIRQLALYDALTSLPNRSFWLKKAQMALRTAQRHEDLVAVLFLDLDQFKTVNDSLGHTAGDRLLAIVARRLAESLREDDVLARLGGDEFVALLPRLRHDDDAATVARKMLALLAEPIDLDGHELSLSVSIGIAVYPADGGDVDTLLKHADIAMYSAKDAGRNNFQFFIPEMNARALDRLMLESGLRRAIERNELMLHYQPQVDGTSGRLLGVEALLRWKHPELGLVPPDRFIPVAENCGLISPVGAWVMQAAFRQQRAWADAGRQLMMAVNISALQFRRPDFVDSVRVRIEEAGADPAMIELEITESALMQPTDELFAQLHRLVGLGISLSLDDFGTGYSSLAYLKRLPIRRLKLDRSFVKDLPGDAEDAAIASAAISMARDLGIEIVAEGVETRAQLEYLAARGCHIMQGYLFSRPLDAAAFEARFPLEGAEATPDWLLPGMR
ncbi:MAG: EAL domain-containing protein [Rhodocyclaceae bacterium]